MGRRVIVKASDLRLEDAQFSIRKEDGVYVAFVEQLNSSGVEDTVYKMDAYYVEDVLHFEMDFNQYTGDVFLKKYKFISNCFETFTVV